MKNPIFIILIGMASVAISAVSMADEKGKAEPKLEKRLEAIHAEANRPIPPEERALKQFIHGVIRDMSELNEGEHKGDVFKNFHYSIEQGKGALKPEVPSLTLVHNACPYIKIDVTHYSVEDGVMRVKSSTKPYLADDGKTELKNPNLEQQTVEKLIRTIIDDTNKLQATAPEDVRRHRSDANVSAGEPGKFPEGALKSEVLKYFHYYPLQGGLSAQNPDDSSTLNHRLCPYVKVKVSYYRDAAGVEHLRSISKPYLELLPMD